LWKKSQAPGFADSGYSIDATVVEIFAISRHLAARVVR